MQLQDVQQPAGPSESFDDRSNTSRAALAATILRHLDEPGEHVSAVPGLSFFRCDGDMPPLSALYEPSLSLVAQGRKRVVLGDEELHYGESCFLLTSVDLPTISQVLEGSEARPYLSILLRLDLEVVRAVGAEIDMHEMRTEANGSGMALGPVTPELLEAVLRLVALGEQARDIPVLGGLVLREILYRLLMSPSGGRLRQIATLGTQSNRITKVIAWLREHYAEPFRIEDLCDIASMGASTLHHHFRAMTAMSPLQYQKQIRLHEARRLLLTEPADAGTAALRVGYESATQFNREYRRQFGNPPIRDIAALRSRNPR